MYAYTYNFAPEPFTLFILRWNGRFLHLHQNICNNHCNTATKAYHTMNQRTMVADHLQRAMIICHTTVTDVADGFQHIRHRNELILMYMEFRCRYVCDFGWQDKDTVFTCLDEHPNASRETLQRAKAHSWIRQGVFIKTSRTFSKSSSSFWKSPVKCLRNYFQAWIESFHSIFFRKRFHLSLSVCLFIERNIRVAFPTMYSSGSRPQ